MSLRIRRGVSTDLPTPVEGELLYTTDNGNLYVGFLDPSTNTVVPRLTSGQLIDDPNPTLAANLDLAGNNIVGVGNIQIDGTVFASGEINLGDGVEDNVIVGGQIGSNLIPNLNDAYDLGTDNVRWRTGYFKGLNVDGEMSLESIRADRFLGTDSSEVYNSNTGVLSAEVVEAGRIEGDLVGSVFSDDSTTLIDSLSNTLRINEIESLSPELSFMADQIGFLSAKTIDNFPLVKLRVFNQSIDNPQEFDPEDTVGGFQIEGLVQDEFKFAGGFGVQWALDADFNTPRPKARLVMQAGNNDEQPNLTQVASLEGNGTFSAPVLKPGTYADEDARDAAIPNPEAGMVIFLAGHNDSTGTPKFQGFDGTNWIDFY